MSPAAKHWNGGSGWHRLLPLWDVDIHKVKHPKMWCWICTNKLADKSFSRPPGWRPFPTDVDGGIYVIKDQMSIYLGSSWKDIGCMQNWMSRRQSPVEPKCWHQAKIVSDYPKQSWARLDMINRHHSKAANWISWSIKMESNSAGGSQPSSIANHTLGGTHKRQLSNHPLCAE